MGGWISEVVVGERREAGQVELDSCSVSRAYRCSAHYVILPVTCTHIIRIR